MKKLEGDRDKMVQNGTAVARAIGELANNLMKLVELEKTKMLNEAKEQTSKSIGRSKEEIADKTRHEKFIESSLGKIQKLLLTSTNIEVVQLRKSIETIFDKFSETIQERSLPELSFMENKKDLHTVPTEKIGLFNRSIPKQRGRGVGSQF